MEVQNDLLHLPAVSTIFYPKTQLSSVTAPGMPTSWEKAPLPKFTEEDTMIHLAQ